MTKTHLKRYQPGDNIKITQEKKFRHIIAPFFAKPKGWGVVSTLIRKLINY